MGDKRETLRIFRGATTLKGAATITRGGPIEVCRMPLTLEGREWNVITLDFRLICRQAFGVEFQAMSGIRINSNCLLRRVFLSDREYRDAELPVELKLWREGDGGSQVKGEEGL